MARVATVTALAMERVVHARERVTKIALRMADSILTPRRANPKTESISETISSSVRSFPSEAIQLINSANSRVLYCVIDGLRGIGGLGFRAWAGVSGTAGPFAEILL